MNNTPNLRPAYSLFDWIAPVHSPAATA